MSFADEMAEGFAEASAELGTVPVVLGGTTYQGNWDPLVEDQTTIVGGQEVKITGVITLGLAQFAPGVRPRSNRPIRVDGRAFRTADVISDEVAFTVSLTDADAA